MSVASNVGIANLALIALGANQIISFTENAEEARKINGVFTSIRDEMLRGHPWNFTIARVALAAGATPVFGFSNSHVIPGDCLKVLGTNLPSDTEYKIEQGKVISDQSAVSIKYIKRITDPTKYTSDFITAFAAEIAAVLAYSFTSSRTFAEEARKIADDKIATAKGTDAQAGLPDELESDEFIDVRRE